jgi:hypothetical protein
MARHHDRQHPLVRGGAAVRATSGNPHGRVTPSSRAFRWETLAWARQCRRLGTDCALRLEKRRVTNPLSQAAKRWPSGRARSGQHNLAGRERHSLAPSGILRAGPGHLKRPLLTAPRKALCSRSPAERSSTRTPPAPPGGCLPAECRTAERRARSSPAAHTHGDIIT